jgi:hypothetical protein
MPMLRIRKSFHSSVANASRPSIERRQHFALGQLDLAQRVDAERAAVLLLSDGRVVGQFDFGIEAACEHAFVAVDHRLADAHVLQLQARQGGHEGIGAGIESGGDDVDQLDMPLFLGARLEQLMLAGADGLFPELALDNLEPSAISSSSTEAQ